MERISAHCYVFRDSRKTNLGMIVTPRGPVLVDSPLLPDDARALRDAVQHMSTQRPIYIINTDHHLGHALGNWAFPEAQVIAHRHAAHVMLEKYDATFRTRLIESFRSTQPAVALELESLPMPRPTIGAVDEMSLHLDDFTVRIIHVGGHTSGTQLVHVPEEGVLFAGDVVIEGAYPNLGDANSQQWLAALERIATLKPAVIVPGHGNLATTETLAQLDTYIRALVDTVGAYYAAGMSRKDVVSKVKSLDGFPIDVDDRARSEQRLKASLQRVYDEFKERDKQLEKA
ncbi:MAG: MBL fold metallo-hydrolase [Chloroflexi bacterium]|nr:MBL fold metallo-hydrolase [Chloroflexota bacterium]